MPFDGTNLTELQRVLIEARALIEKGWIKGQFERNGKYCVMGAIREAGNKKSKEGWDTATTINAMDLFHQVIRRYNLYGNIAQWNDAKSRRKHQVLETFDRAITKALEQNK